MNLDISNLFLFCLISLVLGAVVMLIVQYYIFLRFFKWNSDEVGSAAKLEEENDVNRTPKFSLPEVSRTFDSEEDD